MVLGTALVVLTSHLRAVPRLARPIGKELLRPKGRRRNTRRSRYRRGLTKWQIVGVVLVLIALAQAGLVARLVPEPLGDASGGALTALTGYLPGVASFQDVLGAADGFPLWLMAGSLGLLLLLAPERQRRTGVSQHPPTTTLPVFLAGRGKPAPGSELASALGSCKGALASVALFSGVSNILMLNGAVFMLQVYDRVLPSRSVPTLVGLAMLAGILFLGQAIIDIVRGRVMTRIGTELDALVSGRVFSAICRLPLLVGHQGDGLQPQRDLDSVRTFLSGPGPNALFELPWLPFYLAVIWSFHPILGITAICGAAILVLLTAVTEFLTRNPAGAAVSTGVRRNILADASRRNAEVVAAMGMGRRLHDQWQDASRQCLAQQQRVSDVTGGLGSVSRALRLMLQSAMLGVGAWLVIHGEATAGIIIAGSILVGRALAPVDLAIAHWRNFVGARQSWRRLSQLLARLPPDAQPMALPAPKSKLTVDRVMIGAPGTQRVVVQGIELNLDAGSGLGIIGPSGSGKSSLVRALVGAWRPLGGWVKLDGAALDQWPPEQLGRHLGYLPQDVELFAGSVADNIARFDPNADPGAVVAAARAAGVHDLVVSLPNGYETQIGEGGAALSAGQRQRVALARALYGNPFLVVLDEPNSNLDVEGEIALAEAIRGIKVRAGIVVIVAHRPTILSEVDFVLAMKEGQMHMLGPRERVLAKLYPLQPANSANVKPVAISPNRPN
ncbi:MAG: type I secretion system permease/ATPase [Ensifer alkalisoli]|nr:type I secretion system permease/ATPase [Sinorhizobium alkalisoli]